jgi:hypothetical protein
MESGLRARGVMTVFGQSMLAIAVLPVLYLWPVSGRDMMLLPITGSSQSVIKAALADDAKIVSSGPFSGSLVVRGGNGDLIEDVIAAGGIVIGAIPIACSGKVAKRGDV